MKALITGVTGFIGSWLAEYLLDMGVDVYGLKRWRSPLKNINLIKDKIGLIDGELTDYNSIYKIIRMLKPDKIFHLAAQSYVTTSFTAPRDTIETNAIGTLNLLESVKDVGHEYNPIIHICSSSEVFGQVTKEELPITENSPLRPMSPYAVSKVCEDMLAWQYFKSYGLRTIRTRQFTTTGPRRGQVFVESSIAKQVAECERNTWQKVCVGNIDSIRTWLDARDIVKAYWLLTEKCVPGDVYIIKGDHQASVADVLQFMLDHSKRPTIEYVVDPNRLRPSDVTLQIPSDKKFRDQTGWVPEIPFNQTMSDLLNYWRQEIFMEG